MKLLNFLKQEDINSKIEEYKNTDGAVLLDVRTPQEVSAERIEGSINIPLDSIDLVETEIPDKKTPLFVHCRSGVRSARAVTYLKQIGYENVINIGGIADYTGKKIRG